MTALKDAVVADTLARVKIAYLDRDTSRWFNARRKPHDTVAFCGWFWVHGDTEAGPFRTRSSALRDAYYRFVLHREAPELGQLATNGPPRQAKPKAAPEPRKPRPIVPLRPVKLKPRQARNAHADT